MQRKIKQGRCDLPSKEAKSTAVLCILALGMYPSRKTMIAKFGLTESQVGRVITEVRKLDDSIHLNKDLDKVLYSHLKGE